MNPSGPATATLSADRQTVTLRKGSWSDTFPAARLPGMIGFYRGMALKHTRQAHHYTPTVAALERVQKMLAVLGG